MIFVIKFVETKYLFVILGNKDVVKFGFLIIIYECVY